MSREDIKNRFDILTHEEWSHGEVIRRFDYLEVEPMQELLNSHDKLKQERDEAIELLEQARIFYVTDGSLSKSIDDLLSKLKDGE